MQAYTRRVALNTLNFFVCERKKDARESKDMVASPNTCKQKRQTTLQKTYLGTLCALVHIRMREYLVVQWHGR